MTPDPARGAERALAAASAKVTAGAFDAARDLLAIAETGPLSDFQQARIDLIEGELAFLKNRGSDAPPLLLKAAHRLEPIDAGLSRATYLQAMAASIFAGRLALGGGMLELARAAAAAPPPHAPRVSDLLLDGLVAHYTKGFEAGLPILRKALNLFDTGLPMDDELPLHWMSGHVARYIWDEHSWDVLSDRHVRLIRSAGALSELPGALNSRTFMLLFAGELAAAASMIQQLRTAIAATGSNRVPYAALGLAAFAGRQAETATLIEAINRDIRLRGEGFGITVIEWLSAVLNNGLGNYEAAVETVQHSTDDLKEMIRPRTGLWAGSPAWPAVELIEAAARSGRTEMAADALAHLAVATNACGTDWALGVEARLRALLSDGDTAERCYRESIERLGRSRMRVDLARAHLLYGEWLRGERRRVDARAQLRIAHDMLEAMGMEAFAERARRELEATGATARKRTVAAGDEQLTAQEAQIARMARDGLSNPEIAASMFISGRTVQYHLKKVFTKLGISSRSQLERVLPD